MKVFCTWTLLVLYTVLSPLNAQFRPYDQNRIAISGDGNSAPDYKHKWPTGDPDDWGAVPAILATLAKEELQDRLVHFSYNNFIEAPAGPYRENQMKIGADWAIDPDGDRLTYRWWIVTEAGSYPGQIHILDPGAPQTTMKIPTGAGGKQIHLILEIQDHNPIASLFDYKRIVIDVDEVVVGHESVQDQ